VPGGPSRRAIIGPIDAETIDDLPITRRMLGVDLVGSRRIQPAHVAWPVGPDGSRRLQNDRLDDHRDDQGASDGKSDAKAAPWG
jgi:hypothetical protein